jgi:acyl-CoA thioester hydrolase
MSRSAAAARMEGHFPYHHPIEIRYGDTDALGHVNNAVYLSYFEAARGGYYRVVTGHAFGAGPDADQRTFVIAEAHVAYRSPARFGEPLSCRCRVGWLGRSSFALEYRLDAEASEIDGERVVADGSTVQVFFDLETGRPRRMPPELVERLTAFEGRPLPPRSAP